MPPKAAKADASKASAKAATGKPAWALTEEKADAVEDEEAEALVDFANNLDYDSYIDDLEVRQALSVIRERIDQEKAIEAVAQAAEESAAAIEESGGDWRDSFMASWNGDADDAVERASRSTAPARRAGADACEATKPDWDASTSAGDVHKTAISEGTISARDDVSVCGCKGYLAMTQVLGKLRTSCSNQIQTSLQSTRCARSLPSSRLLRSLRRPTRSPICHR
jgi:hypothetical protein